MFIKYPTLSYILKYHTIKLINEEKKVELNREQDKLSSNVKMFFSIFEIQGISTMFIQSSERDRLAH